MSSVVFISVNKTCVVTLLLRARFDTDTGPDTENSRLAETPIIRTATKAQTNIFYRCWTEINLSYYRPALANKDKGHEVKVPKVFVVKGVDCSRALWKCLLGVRINRVPLNKDTAYITN